jgi:hypothetical protein
MSVEEVQYPWWQCWSLNWINWTICGSVRVALLLPQALFSGRSPIPSGYLRSDAISPHKVHPMNYQWHFLCVLLKVVWSSAGVPLPDCSAKTQTPARLGTKQYRLIFIALPWSRWSVKFHKSQWRIRSSALTCGIFRANVNPVRRALRGQKVVCYNTQLNILYKMSCDAKTV